MSIFLLIYLLIWNLNGVKCAGEDTRTVTGQPSCGEDQSKTQITLVELDIKTKNNTAEYSYSKKNSEGTFVTKDGHGFKKIKLGRIVIWESSDPKKYAYKVVIDGLGFLSSTKNISIYLDGCVMHFKKSSQNDSWEEQATTKQTQESTTANNTTSSPSSTESTPDGIVPDPTSTPVTAPSDVTSTPEASESTDPESSESTDPDSQTVVTTPESTTLDQTSTPVTGSSSVTTPATTATSTPATVTTTSDSTQSTTPPQPKSTPVTTAVISTVTTTSEINPTPSTPVTVGPAPSLITTESESGEIFLHASFSESDVKLYSQDKSDPNKFVELDANKYELDKSNQYIHKYTFNNEGKCVKFTLKNHEIWKHGDNNCQEYPKTIYLHKGKTIVFIEFPNNSFNFYRFSVKDNNMKLETLRKLEDNFESKHKLLTLEGDGSSTKENDKAKYELKKYDFAYEYKFNSDAKCTSVKFDGKEVWKYDSSHDQNNYPLLVYFLSKYLVLFLKNDKCFFIDPDKVL